MDQLSLYCVTVLSRGSLEDVQRMAEAVSKVTDMTVIEYQKHILFPLIKRLQCGTRSEKTDSCLLETLKTVLDRVDSQFRDAELLYNVLLTLLSFFCSLEGGFRPHVSEDHQLTLTQILYTIFMRADHAMIIQIYTEKEYEIVVSPLIKILVDLISHRSKELKLNSIRALRASFLDGRIEVVKTMSNFLPGIILSLRHQITDFTEKSYRIFNAALEALTDAVKLVMTDDVDLGEKFYKRAAPNLTACFSTLIKVCCPPHFKECEPACKYFATGILTNCSLHLEDSIPICLEILLTLEDPRYINMENFTSLTRSAELISIKEKFLEYFEKLFVRMPRISAVGLDSEKTSLIRQLHGLLRICPDTIRKAMENELSRKRFLISLFQLVSLDCTMIRISPVEEPCNECVKNLHRQTKSLDERSLTELRAFCQSYGERLSLSMCRDILLESINMPRWRSEAALIFSFVVEGLRPEENEGTDLIEYVIESLPSDDSAAAILQKVFFLMLLRQLISKVRPLSVNILPYLLANQANDIDVCIASAEKALFETPKAIGFANLEDLLTEKAEDIVANLEDLLLEDPSVFHLACRGLFAYLPERAIEAYDPLFITLINHLAVGDTVETLTTLHHLVRCFHSQCPPQRLKIDTPRKESLKHLAARLLREVEAAHAIENNAGDESCEDFNPSDMLDQVKEEEHVRYSDGDKQTVDLPIPVRVCRDILDACVNMQSGGIFVHTKAFEVIAESIIFIETYEDELLPMVHIIWEALVHRLKCSDDSALSVKALAVLSALCRTSRSFVRDRIVKELWPKFCSFLHKQRKVSSGNPFREYRHLCEYKYQLAILEFFGSYAIQLDLREEHLSPILAEVVPYLMDSRQPAELHRAATNTLNQMTLLSPECVRFSIREAILSRWTEGCPWCKLRLQEQPDPVRALEEFPNLAAVWV